MDETAQETAPELNLEIDNNKLAKFIETYEKKYDKYAKEKKLKERRDNNVRYLFGKQATSTKKYLKEDVDNLIKETEDTLRTLVLSRMPDLIVNPGTDSQVPRETADIISEAVNKTLQSDELKKLLTKAFRRHSLDFLGCIKYYWNSGKGRLGDIDWQVIPMKYIKFDISATENDQEEMRMIIHETNKTLSDWMMLFPKKEEELKKYAREKGWNDDKDEDGIAFDMRIKEVWFRWKEKAQDFNPEDPKFDFYSGILWKAGKGEDSILDKRQNPNWDWEGEEEVFFEGQPVPNEMLPQLAFAGLQAQGIENKRVYRNYFGKPRLPFIFMGYEQYGEQALDETSRIEEARPLQDNYDYRRMQITKMIDDARGKHIFSTMSGLTKKTVDEMDLNDPDEDVVVDGELGQVHAFIAKEQPSQAMFADLASTEDRIREKYHVAGAVSGELTSDVATTAQIQRESSFTLADDLSQLMINEVATKMAEALLHMMKLRYTDEHFRALVGTEGEMAQVRLARDLIEDGMEVAIKASGTDKLKAEREAKEEAKLGLIDPVSYMKDTGRDDPEHRAELAFLWNNYPELYYKKVIQKQNISQIAGGVIAQNQANLAQAQTGGVQGIPAQPSPQNITQPPTVPQGSPRNLIGRAGATLSRIFNR